LAQLVPGERSIRLAVLREQLASLAVIVEIHEKDEFAGSAAIDLMFFPHAIAAPGILHPDQALGEVRATDDIDVAIPIDIDGQIAEVIDIIVRKTERAEFVFDPARSLEPIFAGYQIELAVIVDVGYCAGLTRAQVDRVLLKRDFAGTSDGP